MLSIAHITQRKMIGWSVNNELKWVWKETVASKLKAKVKVSRYTQWRGLGGEEV
jgi:hypothetical protein